MKLKKFLKLIDPISFDVRIFINNDEEPIFEGSALDIPWGFIDLKIGRIDKSDKDEPIYFYHTENGDPACVINLIEE